MLAQILLPSHFSPFQNVQASCERSLSLVKFRNVAAMAVLGGAYFYATMKMK